MLLIRKDKDKSWFVEMHDTDNLVMGLHFLFDLISCKELPDFEGFQVRYKDSQVVINH